MKPIDPCSFPDLRYLQVLSDAFGIVQHTGRGTPRLEYGYAIDDVARALIVAVETLRVYAGSPDVRASADVLLRCAETYLRFVEFCQRPDGRFHNFVTAEHTFQDDVGSADSYGRTLWALAVTHVGGRAVSSVAQWRERAERMLRQALPHVQRTTALRGKAFSILALSRLASEDDPFRIGESLIHLVRDLVHAFHDGASDEWLWFEDHLSYSNAGILYGLLTAAGTPLVNAAHPPLAQEAQAIGLRALDFLLKVLPINGVPAPVGNNGWFARGGPRAVYDQQCVDVAAMGVACAAAWKLTRDPRYQEAAFLWWSWFFGNNTQERSLYRPEDGAVYDGVTPDGVNEDRGAESVVTFLIAHLVLSETFCEKRC